MAAQNLSSMKFDGNIENVQNVIKKSENIINIEENSANIEENNNVNTIKDTEFQTEIIQKDMVIDSENIKLFEDKTVNSHIQIESEEEQANTISSEEKNEANIEQNEIIQEIASNNNFVTDKESNSKNEPIVCYEYTLTEEDIENVLSDYEKHVALGDVACSEDYIIILQDKIKRSHEKDFIN